jgi:hypothetical protein
METGPFCCGGICYCVGHYHRGSPTISRTLLFLAALLAICLPGSPALAAGWHASPAVSPVTVSDDSFLAHSEPALAINPRNHNNLLAASKMFTDPDHYRFSIGTYYSMNGGRTWHDSGLLPGLDQYPDEMASDVSIAFGPGGTAYVCVLVWDGGNLSGIDVLRSRDGGKTFSPPVAVYTDTTGGIFNDKPWIAVDTSQGPHRGTIYVAWNADGIGADGLDPDAGERTSNAVDAELLDGIEVSRSTDAGKTFSDPVEVATFDQDHY